MQNPYDSAHQLARSIRQSEIYRELQEAQQEIENNPKYKEMISTLRQTQLELQNLSLQGKELPKEKKEQVEKMMLAIEGIPPLIKYLQAEERFGILINDIQKIVFEPVNDIFKEKV
jgi:cell fate (sporulation/competence/biofilm development) regulator YlbF (YheA/YmcA/DUF963 family)